MLTVAVRFRVDLAVSANDAGNCMADVRVVLETCGGDEVAGIEAEDDPTRSNEGMVIGNEQRRRGMIESKH